MTPRTRSLQSYRHEAFLWQTPAEFTGAMVAFVEEGVEAGEPVVVVLTPEHTQWLREGLGAPVASRVRFLDITRLGRTPARIIPIWRQLVTEQSEPRRPVRGIAEPVWPGRHPEELAECHLHEALLNVAIDPDTPLWLICPYDAQSLRHAVLEEAHRSHPVIIEAGSHRGSARYIGRGHVESLFAADLVTPTSRFREITYRADTVHRLPAFLRLELHVGGLPVDRAARVAAATHNLVLGSLHRGSPVASIRIWSDPDALVFEVFDHVPIRDPLAGRKLDADDHDGLWQANQVCDLVQLRSTLTGTTVRGFSWKSRRRPGFQGRSSAIPVGSEPYEWCLDAPAARSHAEV